MGTFALLESGKYIEFCDLFKASMDKSSNEKDSDLLFGNYILALLGLKKYRELKDFCQQSIDKMISENDTTHISASYYLGLAISCSELGLHSEASMAYHLGSNANYQDLSRTRVARVMYLDAARHRNSDLKQRAVKILRSRLKSKSTTGYEFSIAKYLADTISFDEMLNQINDIGNSIIQIRYKVCALLSLATKLFEQEKIFECQAALRQIKGLYEQNTIVVIEIEYHLAINWLEDIGL